MKCDKGEEYLIGKCLEITITARNKDVGLLMTSEADDKLLQQQHQKSLLGAEVEGGRGKVDAHLMDPAPNATSL